MRCHSKPGRISSSQLFLLLLCTDASCPLTVHKGPATQGPHGVEHSVSQRITGCLKKRNKDRKVSRDHPIAFEAVYFQGSPQSMAETECRIERTNVSLREALSEKLLFSTVRQIHLLVPHICGAPGESH